MKLEQLKEEVFNKYFEKRVLNYPVSREGVNVTTYLVIADGRLGKHFEALKQKYAFKKSWRELQAEYIFQSWDAIQKFESADGVEGWEGILDSTNVFEEMRLIKYIKTTVAHKIYEFVNPHAFRTTTTDNGKRVHYTLVMEFESLDALLTQDVDGHSVQLTNANNAFDGEMYEYYVSHFQKWYEANKERILTSTQLQFLEDLRRCSNDIYLTAEDFEKETGVKWSDKSRRLKKIGERIERAWNAQKPKKQSRKQVFDGKKLEYFREYMQIVEDDSVLEAQNLLLTNHLIKGMNDKSVEFDVFEVVNDCLFGDELIQFNSICEMLNNRNVALNGSILYKVTAGIEKRLSELEKNQSKKVNEGIVTGQAKRKSQKKRTELITYDKAGNVIKHELKLEQDYAKNNNIYYILPTGATTQKR